MKIPNTYTGKALRLKEIAKEIRAIAEDIAEPAITASLHEQAVAVRINADALQTIADDVLNSTLAEVINL